MIPLGQPENFTVANTNWQTPPAISASGYFLITRTIPSNASGNGLIVGIWVRNDPAGEFFISCSDVKLQGGAVPDPLTPIGTFINADMQAVKPGDEVHYRIFASSGERNERVDIRHKITTANLAPGQWGAEVAAKVDPSVARIGILNDGAVRFDPAEPFSNITYATDPHATDAMSIITGEGPGPVNPAAPVARITGPNTLKSGQTFTFSGTGSTGSNGPLLYQWTIPGLQGSQSESTASGQAYAVTQTTPFKARLNVRDQQNGKTSQAEFDFTVTPGGGGETYPPYVPNGNNEAGKIYAHKGEHYKCKYTSWCSGSPMYYEPGVGLAWQEAWDKL